MNLKKNLQQRRWMHEYIINYTEAEEESADFENCESKWGGIPTQNIDFERCGVEYLGEWFTNSLGANIDTGYGLETIVKNKDGKIMLAFG